MIELKVLCMCEPPAIIEAATLQGEVFLFRIDCEQVLNFGNSHLANFHSSLVVKTPDAATTSLQMTPLYGLCGKPGITIMMMMRMMVMMKRQTVVWFGWKGKSNRVLVGSIAIHGLGSLGLPVIRPSVWGSPRGLVGSNGLSPRSSARDVVADGCSHCC